MRVWRCVATLAFAMILSLGCATDPPLSEEEQEDIIEHHNLTAEPGDRLICRVEVPTGSHRRRKICRTASQMERERQQVESLLEPPNSPGSPIPEPQ